MADWQRKLELKDVWDKTVPRGGDITIQQLAGIVADRLEKLKPFGGDNADLDETRADLVSDFRDMSKDEDADEEEFDYFLDSLYDWADTPMGGDWPGKKACWVETF